MLLASIIFSLTWITSVHTTASKNSLFPWPNREVTQIPKLHERLLENFKTSKPRIPMDIVLMRPCLQNPCLNGGRCTYDAHHGVRCLCTHFYVGDNCEHRLPPPSNVTMTRASPDSVTVAWAGPKAPIQISGFRVQYNMFGEGLTLHSQIIHPSVFNYSITGLLPRTQYTVCVNIILNNITMREAILRDQCVEVMTTDEYIHNLNWKTVTILAGILVFIFALILIIALMVQRRRLLKYYVRSLKVTPALAPVELTKKVEITKITKPSIISSTLPMNTQTVGDQELPVFLPMTTQTVHDQELPVFLPMTTQTVHDQELPVFRRAQTQTCYLDRVDVTHQHTQTPPIVERHTKPNRGKKLSLNSSSGYSSNSSCSSSSIRYTSLPNNYTPCPSSSPNRLSDHININMEERKMAFCVSANSDTIHKKVTKSVKAQRTATFASTRFVSNRESEDSDSEATVPYFLPRFNTLYQTNRLRGTME